MQKQIAVEAFQTQLGSLLEETFERTQGIFLDRGTSLFDTLDGVSAEEASRPVSATCACIAAQVEHTRFYLEILGGIIRGQEFDPIDWEATWQLRKVTPDEWAALKERLREAYEGVMRTIEERDVWEGEGDIGASLAILAHTAYHLGEIRQALCTVR